MIEASAIHATTATRRSSILREGFRPSTTGRRGTGVYFWRKTAHWQTIGEAWHRAASRLKTFTGDADPTLSIVHVVLRVPKARFLDLDSDDLRDTVSDIAFSQKIDSGADSELINNLYNDLILTVEQGAGIKIAVLRSTIAVPDMSKEYPFQVLGNPTGYIVRDVSCIQEMV